VTNRTHHLSSIETTSFQNEKESNGKSTLWSFQLRT